jgi:hypothetical protein
MEKIKVLICTPMYGGVCTAGFTSSMIELTKQATKLDDIEIQFMYGTNEALITRARNMCAAIFLKSDCTHMLFIDSDIEFNAEEIIRMIRTNKDFVCGIYPKKNINWANVHAAVKGGALPEQLPFYASEYLVIQTPDTKPTEDGLMELERAATGMMMLSKNVYNTLVDKVKTFNLEAPATSNIKFDQTDVYKEYFYTSTDENTNIFLHEDFTFCKLWRENGGKIYGAPWVKLRHIGNYTFG